MTSCLAKYKPGAQIRTDFTTFPTPQFAKVCFINSLYLLPASLPVIFKSVTIFVILILIITVICVNYICDDVDVVGM